MICSRDLIKQELEVITKKKTLKNVAITTLYSLKSILNQIVLCLSNDKEQFTMFQLSYPKSSILSDSRVSEKCLVSIMFYYLSSHHNKLCAALQKLFSFTWKFFLILLCVNGSLFKWQLHVTCIQMIDKTVQVVCDIKTNSYNFESSISVKSI